MDTPVFISVLIYFPADTGNNIPPPTFHSMQISAAEAAARFGIGIVMWEGRRQDVLFVCAGDSERGAGVLFVIEVDEVHDMGFFAYAGVFKQKGGGGCRISAVCCRGQGLSSPDPSS